MRHISPFYVRKVPSTAPHTPEGWNEDIMKWTRVLLNIKICIIKGRILPHSIPNWESPGQNLRVPWTERRSNQAILREISPEYSLEGLMLKLKLQYFDHLMWRTDSLEKTLMLGKIEGRRRRGWQRMRWFVGWHHWLNALGFGWTPGIGDGQGGLVCCRPWVAKSRTQLSNWTELIL